MTLTTTWSEGKQVSVSIEAQNCAIPKTTNLLPFQLKLPSLLTKLKRKLLPVESYLNKATQNILSGDIQHIWTEAGSTFIHWKHTTTTWWLNFNRVRLRVRTLFWTKNLRTFQGHIFQGQSIQCKKEPWVTSPSWGYVWVHKRWAQSSQLHWPWAF